MHNWLWGMDAPECPPTSLAANFYNGLQPSNGRLVGLSQILTKHSYCCSKCHFSKS